MFKESVFCISASEFQSASILDRLKAANFSDDDISVFSAPSSDIIGVGLGIPEYKVRYYQEIIKDGEILISVHTEDSDEATLVKEIFKDEGAQDITTISESATLNHSW